MVLAIYLSVVALVLCGLLYWNFKNSYRLWDKCRVPHLKPEFPFGNYRDILKEVHIGILCQDLYENLKGQGNYAGIYVFRKPTLLVTSPAFAKTVLDRDFDYFMNRGLYYNPKNDPLSANLFFHEGNDWRTLREKLDPAFADGKLNLMFHTLEEAIDDLVDRINTSIDTEIDVMELMKNFIADVSSSCIFGVAGDSINISSAELRKAERKVMNISKPKMLMITLAGLLRDVARQFGFQVFNSKANKFFSTVVHKNIGFRRENNVHRHDLIQMMIELMRQDYESNVGLTIDEIVSNTFMFFFMEFGSGPSTLTFALFHLAQNEAIQDAARQEINSVLKQNEGKLTFKALQSMILMDRILSETLRMYPPIVNLYRRAVKNYKLPNGFEIPKGTDVIVPVYALHHDERFYSNPEKFDPNRFLDNIKNKRHSFAYLPFGGGPRSCIGRKLALMQAKLALANILSRFRISVTDRTPIELEIDNNAMTFIPLDQVWLKFDKVEN